MRSVLLAILLLSGCPSCDPVPDPQPSDVMPPMGTGGAPAPHGTGGVHAGSPCEDMCVNRAVHGCDGAGAGCVETCERYQELAIQSPALDEHPTCQARADTCAAMDACRGH